MPSTTLNQQRDRLRREEARKLKRRVPLSDRKRLPKACEPCRWRKTKCSGTIPCDGCKRRNAHDDCTYFTPSTRGPEQSLNNPLSTRFGSPMLLDLSRREDLDPLLSCNEPSGHTMLPAPSEPLAHQATETDAAQEHTSSSSGESSRLTRKHTFTERSTPEKNITQFIPDRRGEFQFIGEAGYLSFLEAVRLWVAEQELVMREQGGPESCQPTPLKSGNRASTEADAADSPENRLQLFGEGSVQRDLDDDSGRGPEDIYTAMNMSWMSRDEMRMLLRSAAEGTPLVRLLFRVKDCEDWIDALSEQQAGGSKGEVRRKRLGKSTVLYLLFSLGLLYLPASDASKAQARDARAIAALDSAALLMRKEMLAEEGGMLAVQAYALASVACLTVCKRQTAWVYLGTSIRCAQALGMHRKMANQRHTQQERSLRSQIWWCLYLLDRIISTSHGRPLAIDDQDCEDFSIQDFPSDTYSWEGMWLAVMVKLSQLHGRIQTELYRRSNDISSADAFELSIHRTRRMLEELRSIKRDLPNELKSDRLRTTSTTETRGALLQLHLEYYSAFQHLTRKSLLLSARRSLATLQCSRYASAETALFAKASVACATETISLFCDLFAQNALPRRCLSLVYNIFVSGLVLATHVFSHVIDRDTALSPEDQRLLDRVDDALEVLQFFWQTVGDFSAERFFKTLSLLQANIRAQGRSRTQQNNHPGGHRLNAGGQVSSPQAQGNAPPVTDLNSNYIPRQTFSLGAFEGSSMLSNAFREPMSVLDLGDWPDIDFDITLPLHEVSGTDGMDFALGAS